MKIFILLLSFLFQPVLAKPITSSASKQPENPEVTKQLASLITYPPSLSEKNGIVIVQFYLTDGASIGKVRVFSESTALNADLIRQLTGKKLSIAHRSPFDRYTVKLVFRVE